MYGAGLVVLAAMGLVLYAAVHTANTGLVELHVALAFGALICVGEAVRITLPGDREAAPLGSAGALAYALLPAWRGVETSYGTSQVITVTAAAVLIGVFPHAAVGRPVQLDSLARRLLTVALAAAMFRLDAVQSWVGQEAARWLVAIVLVGIVAVTSVVDAALAAAARGGRDGTPYAGALRDELTASTGIASAIGATGILIALAATIMGVWALPVFAVPLLLTQFSFRRYAAIRATYLQTIRALSRVTEVGGYTETGHARRVSDVCVAVGRELGLPEAGLLDLEYAALMHDIGQLSLTDPIPGGATVVAAPDEQRRIASLGAEVIRATGVLDEVATIVEKQAEPYRQAHQSGDHSVPLASRIIRAVNAYDDLVGDSLESSRHLEALERLRLGMAYEYDPRVVEALGRVIGRAAR
jgi:hypothetical protein